MRPPPFFSSALHRRSPDEPAFMQWYKDWATRTGLSEDPDDPAHQYDYREAFRRGIEPELDEASMEWHWPSVLKMPDHPNRFVDGVDTITGERVGGEDEEPLGRPQEAAPPQPAGLLERIADSMSDMGYGGGEEAKRAALRRALGAMGSRMAAGALKEGTAAIAPAISAGFDAYGGGLEEQRARRDLEEKQAQAAQGDQVQQDYMRALTEQIQGKPGAAAEEARRKLRERMALVAERRAVLETLAPEQAKLMAPFVGSEKWDEYLFKVTGDKPKEDGGFTLGEGQVRYDAEGNVIARGPAKTFAPDRGGDAWGSGKLITRGSETIVVYPDGTKRSIHTFEGGGADPMPQIRQMAQSLFNARVERADGPMKKTPDGSEILDSEAVYRDSFSKAVKMYEDQMKEMRRPAPGAGGAGNPNIAQANHILNQTVADLRDGAGEAEILAALRRVPNLYGYTPETYLKKAKELARSRRP